MMKRLMMLALALAALAFCGQQLLAAEDAPKASGLDALYQSALHQEQAGGNPSDALDTYSRVVAGCEAVAPLASRAQLHIARIYERQGKSDEAIAAYRTLVEKFPASPEAAVAIASLSGLGAAVETSVSLDAEIERKLARRLAQVELANATIDQMADYIKSVAEINIVVDARVRSIAPQDGPGSRNNEPTASLSLRDIAVRDVLNLAAQSFGLDWTVWSGAVYISTDAVTGELRRKRAATATAGEDQTDAFARSAGLKDAKSAELFRQGLLNFEGPQALDVDTGSVTPVPNGADVREFLAKSRDFDIAYLPPYGLIVGPSCRAALVSQYTSVETLPKTVSYPEPASAGPLIEFLATRSRLPEPARSAGLFASGIYATDDGYEFLYRVNACVLQTARGEYFIVTNGAGNDRIVLRYRKVSDKGASPEEAAKRARSDGEREAAPAPRDAGIARLESTKAN
jgi:tetratricopeptide (TPR) repeat protein